MQTHGLAFFALLGGATCACSGASSNEKGTHPDAAAEAAKLPGPDAAADSAVPDAKRVPDSSTGDVGDTGALAVTCGSDTPFLVVTQTSGGAHGTTLLRLSLQFSGAASGIQITAVTQRAADASMTTVRDWGASSLTPPPGFTGSVAPVSGVPRPSLLFTETAPIVMSETDACTKKPWDRPGGTIHVTGTTKEAGGFALDCSYSLIYQGNNAEPLRLACATGMPGWLGGQGSDLTAIDWVKSPIDAVLVTSAIHAFNAGSAAASGFVASSGTLTAHVNTIVPPGLMCPMTGPMPWSLGGGINTLWAGSSGLDTWTGPVAPGQQADANWQYELNGAMPMPGYCVPASTSPMTCPPPVSQAVLAGTSSAGPFEWESDLFSCFTLM